MTTRCALWKGLIFLHLFLIAAATHAQNKKTVPAPRDTSRALPVILTTAPRTGPKPYKDLITGKAITKNGLFRIHHIEEKWYFEIPDSLLNRDILLVNRISRAPANTRAGSFGYAGDEINENVIRFEKGPTNKIFLLTISYAVYSKDTAGPMYKSVMNSNIQPITAAFDIRAFAKDSNASVIDMTDILTGDNEVFFFAASYKSSLRLGGLQSDKSYVMDIKTYPMNTEIRTVKTYTRVSGIPLSGFSSGPGGYSTFELNSSMVLLPQQQMRPRYFDDRVAYFTNDYTDYDSDPQGVKDVSVITRWRLEPKAEDTAKYYRGELVEPAKPIVFYIDPSTPAKWVPYLIEGVNDWQKCFEKAGFKNAITARRAPTNEEDSTWSLEDARYSAIVYKPSEVSNAQGPHVHDPRTGEILESHVNWYHNVMSLLQRWYTVQAGAGDPRARKPVLPDSLMGQLIRFASSHEIGHALGLPHNMGASSATPVEKLRDRKWLETNAYSPSIMDYARFNYVAQPEDSVPAKGLMPRIGAYDEWSVEWGYRLFNNTSAEEEKKILNDWVKKKSTDKRLRFLHADGADPRAQQEDLGDDAVKAGYYGIKNLKKILPQLPEWEDKSGENYDKLEKFYDELFTQFARYIGHAVTYIGGVYTDAKTTDQPGAVYSSVPKAKQKEALLFISKNLFDTPQWLMNTKVLNLFSSPDDRISSLQDTYLANLLSTARLQRIISASNRDGKNAYTIDEYVSDLTNEVWSELKSHKPVSNYRRNLQKSFVEKIISIVNPSQAPTTGFIISFGPVVETRKSDILSVSKAALRTVRDEIKTALPGYTDKMSRYHLMDVQERIDRIFKLD